MSTTKTVTGYAVTLVAVLALVVAACGIDTETPAAPQPQPPVEDVTVSDDTTASDDTGDADGIDEYDTVLLLSLYEESLEYMPGVIETLFDPFMCELYDTPQGKRDFWGGFFDSDMGFWSTAPDELQYILTDAEIKADVAPMIDTRCAFLGVS